MSDIAGWTRGLMAVLFCALLALGSTLSAQAQTVIYQDDFEGSVSGWSVNDTDFDNDTTNFLGRFANGNTTTSRTFTVPAGATSLEIEFDLYRFDSWDFFNTNNSDGFAVEINGAPLFSTTANFGTFDHLALPTNGLPAGSGTTGNVDWSHTPVRGPEHFAFNMGGGQDFWREQIHHFTLTVNNPGTSVTLTLRAELDQEEGDESAGYDNFLVTAIAPTPIDAVDNNFTATPFPPGASTPNILANDDLGGAVPTLSNVNVNVTNNGGLTGLSGVNSDGTLTIPASAAPGLYTVTYEICETANPTNCDTADVLIEVLFIPTPRNDTGQVCTQTRSLVQTTDSVRGFDASGGAISFARNPVSVGDVFVYENVVSAGYNCLLYTSPSPRDRG